MNVDLSPLWRALDPWWKLIKQLFAEHHFLTIVCAFFVLMLIISCYKFLRSISPALVGFLLLIVVAMLFLHWTQTRTEPALLKPAVDFVAPLLPSPGPQRIAPGG